MLSDFSEMPMLLRRQIEAQIAGPLIKAFITEFGREKTLKVVSEVVKKLAIESGAERAKIAGGNSLPDLAGGKNQWAVGGAIEREVLELTETKFNYNIVRCKYAEMYQELNLADLGFLLSCGRDAAMFQGFNSNLKMTRTQTIMEGADYCDFRLTMKNHD